MGGGAPISYLDLMFVFPAVFIKKYDRIVDNFDRSLIQPSGKGYKVRDETKKN